MQTDKKTALMGGYFSECSPAFCGINSDPDLILLACRGYFFTILLSYSIRFLLLCYLLFLHHF
jgi:hypothetical protein